MSEKEIQDQLLEAAQHLKHYKLKLWRNNTGVAKYKNSNGSYRYVRYGLPGSTDTTGVCYGRGLYLEVKQKGQKQTDQQLKFEAEIRKTGAICYTVHSLDEGLSVIDYEMRFMKKIGWIDMVDKFLS